MNSLAVDELNEAPTELEAAVNLFSKNAQVKEVGIVVPISTRLSGMTYATVKALADHSNQSINRVVNVLLRVAIDALSDALPPEDANQVSEIRAQVMADLLKSGKYDQLKEAD